MKKIGDDLKRMLSGLAHQHAGEFLPMGEKIRAFGLGAGEGKESGPVLRRVSKRSAPRRVALVCDGSLPGATLEFAIDAAARQEAELDLLVHGAASTETLSLQEQQVRNAGLECRRMQLDVNAADAIADYARSNPSLVFLVASTADMAVRRLTEELIPGRAERFPVPLVLIENGAAASVAA